MFSYSGSGSEYIERYRAAVRQERLQRSLLDFFPHRKPRAFRSPPLPLQKLPCSSPRSPAPQKAHLKSRLPLLTPSPEDQRPQRLLPLLTLTLRAKFSSKPRLPRASETSRKEARPETSGLSGWQTGEYSL